MEGNCVTVPNLENGCLGPEAWGLWQSAAAPKHFTERAGRVPMLSYGFQKATGARNNLLHHYLISTRQTQNFSCSFKSSHARTKALKSQ